MQPSKFTSPWLLGSRSNTRKTDETAPRCDCSSNSYPQCKVELRRFRKTNEKLAVFLPPQGEGLGRPTSGGDSWGVRLRTAQRPSG